MQNKRDTLLICFEFWATAGKKQNEQQGEAIFQASLLYALPGPDQGPKTDQIHREGRLCSCHMLLCLQLSKKTA